MKVMIVKELMTGDVSPVAMFSCNMASCHFGCFLAVFGCPLTWNHSWKKAGSQDPGSFDFFGQN